MQVPKEAKEPNAPDGHPFEEIHDAKMRAFLVAYAECGVKHRAAEAAGISPSLIYTRRWRDHMPFQEAMVRAYGMAAEQLEEAARARAVDGVRSYQFDRDGNPLRHPELCECGHGLDHHPRVEGTGARRCEHPDCVEEDHACPAFLGVPYYEHSYSDTLLKFLLTGAKPDLHRTRTVEFRGLLAKIDMARLPDQLVDRIASGDNPLEVLATAAAEAETTPAALIGLDENELRIEAGEPDDESDSPVDL